MKYPFMREFTGVPLVQTESARRQSHAFFLRAAGALALQFKDDLEIDREGGFYFELNLYDSTAHETVGLSGQVGDTAVTQARMSLAETVLAPDPREIHLYAPGEAGGITREQRLDATAYHRLSANAAYEEFTRRLEGRPPEPEPTGDISPFNALNRDEVDGKELIGLFKHVALKIQAGLYVPVGGIEASGLV